jgi:glucokinase
MAEAAGDVILAVDVGGTKTDVGAFAVGGAGRLVRYERYRSAEYGGLEEVLREFIGGEAVAALAVAAAGPVRDGEIRTTNLPWTISAQRLATQLGGVPVQLLNDLEATAAGVLTLGEESFQTIACGVPRTAHRALLAPGTGLGESILYWDGSEHRPYATEGGHSGFAPCDDEQIELLRFLRRRLTAVSYEDVLSGPGLARLFEFVAGPQAVRASVELPGDSDGSGRAVLIGRAAVAGTCAASRRSVALWLRILAARAGDLALSTMALGGIEIAGGMIRELLPLVDGGEFARVRSGIGPLAALRAEVRVRAVLAPRVALLGAVAVMSRELVASRVV